MVGLSRMNPNLMPSLSSVLAALAFARQICDLTSTFAFAKARLSLRDRRQAQKTQNRLSLSEMTEKRVAVKVYLSPDETEHLDRQAAALNLNRSQLIRLRALGDPSVGSEAVAAPVPPVSLRQYQGAVTAALKAASGACSRPIVEAVTAAVLVSLHASPNQSRNPSHPQTVG